MQAILSSPKLGAFIISLMITIAFAVVLWYAVMHGILDNPGLNLLIGAIISYQGAAVNYWLGSSASSKDKDLVIAKQADTTAAAVAQQPPGVRP